MDSALISERGRKELALEHCRRVNAGDVEALLELYGDDVAFADPVGWERRTGRDALRAHFEEAFAAGLREVPGEPTAAQDGAHAFIPITATMDYLPLGPVFAERGWLVPPADPAGKRLRRNSMLLLRVDETGLIREAQVFWGKSDIEVID
ncbi:nuclear transport factor 2 family protein [Actinomadura sp. DC4]|uniref:nuclear transport factor 2 family protein n=1 Tax=Actinomadura sp. DC4 TaxID=3055069 RepID=UPI0025B0C52C|nr:nuclear transport factor 2 family protein [Actinomadura sp. DC4]MDN3360141.1 nuclear transport factor 2 family protein [Actinomadura sp. DC4]